MLIHDGLVRRKSYLDAIMDGLNVFKFKRVICAAPDIFEPMFIGEPLSAQRVKDMVKTVTPPGNDTTKLRILHMVGVFLDSCDEKGMHVIVNARKRENQCPVNSSIVCRDCDSLGLVLGG